MEAFCAIPFTILELSKSFDDRRQPKYINGRRNNLWKARSERVQDEVIEEPLNYTGWSFRHHFLPESKHCHCQPPKEEFDENNDENLDISEEDLKYSLILRRAKCTINKGLKQKIDEEKNKRSQILRFLREIYVHKVERVPTWFLTLFGEISMISLALKPTFPAENQSVDVATIPEKEDLSNAELILEVIYLNQSSTHFVEVEVKERLSFSSISPDHNWRLARNSNFAIVCHSTIRRVEIKGTSSVGDEDYASSMFELIFLNEDQSCNYPRRCENLKGIYRRRMNTMDKYITWKIDSMMEI